MLWLWTLLVIVDSTLGQQKGYLPPRYSTLTSTVTNTITATDCKTTDRFVTKTLEVVNQQLVIVTLCYKNLITETRNLPIVTPVNNHILVETSTQVLRPSTSIVTDVSTNYALKTLTDTATGTLTNRENAFFSITQTLTQTQTLTRTTLVVSTHVNTRIVDVTNTQTVVNTIFVDAPVTNYGYGYPHGSTPGHGFQGDLQDQGQGFFVQGPLGHNQGQVPFSHGSNGFLQGQGQFQGTHGGFLQGQGAFSQVPSGFLQGQEQGQLQGSPNQGGFLQGQGQLQGHINQGIPHSPLVFNEEAFGSASSGSSFNQGASEGTSQGPVVYSRPARPGVRGY